MVIKENTADATVKEFLNYVCGKLYNSCQLHSNVVRIVTIFEIFIQGVNLKTSLISSENLVNRSILFSMSTISNANGFLIYYFLKSFQIIFLFFISRVPFSPFPYLPYSSSPVFLISPFPPLSFLHSPSKVSKS